MTNAMSLKNKIDKFRIGEFRDCVKEIIGSHGEKVDYSVLEQMERYFFEKERELDRKHV